MHAHVFFYVSVHPVAYGGRYLLSLTAEYVASLKFDQERKDRLSKYAAIQRTRQLNRDFLQLTQQLDGVFTKLHRVTYAQSPPRSLLRR